MVMTRRASSKKKVKPDFLVDYLGEEEGSRPIKSSIGAGRRSAAIAKSSGVTAEALLKDDWFASLKRLNSLRRSAIECECPSDFFGIFSIRYSTNGEHFIVSFGGGAIQARSSKDGSLISNIRTESEKKYPVMCVRYHPRYKKFFASGACGKVLTCTLQPGDYQTLIEEKDNEINCIDINPSGSKMATGGKDTVVRIYDIEKRKLLQKYPPKVNLNNDQGYRNHHFMRIFASKFHQISDDILITGGWDNYVKVWDLRIPDGLVRNIKGPHICGDAIDIRDDTILTGSWTVKDSLQLWDLTTGRLIDTIKPLNRPKSIDGEYLYCARFLSGDATSVLNDTVVVGGSGIDAVEIISLLSKKVLGYYKVNKVVQTIDTYNSQIAFGGMDNVIRIGEYSGPEKVEHLEKDSFMHIT